MGKWEMVRLGDVFPYIRNGASIKQEDNATGFPITRIETIADGSINRDRMGFANIHNIELYADFLLQTGDILMSHINSVKHLGKTALYSRVNDENIIHGMNLLNLRSDSSVLDSTYAYRYLNSYYFKKQLPNITKNSVNQSSFNITALKELGIPLPPLEVQRQIADVLDRASALIEKRKAQIERLDLLIKSQFIEMFGDPVTNPKGWEVETLGNHLKVIGGYAFKSTGYKQVGIPVLRIGNINTGVLTLNDMVFWNYDKRLERYIMFPNDLVISLTGTVGKDDYANVCILPAQYPQYYLNQRNAKLDVFGTLNNCYLLYLFRNKEVKKRLTGISRGIRQANISNSDILNLCVPIPPKSLQEEFSVFVERVEAQKSLLQKSLVKLELNYISLMQKCFRGEVF